MSESTSISGDSGAGSPTARPLSVLAKGIDRLEAIARGYTFDAVVHKKVYDEQPVLEIEKFSLWDEVHGQLHESALSLSGGQQQRVCIARAIAGEPDVLLLDEPCSALDPIATGKVEDLIQELQGDFSILVVTHNMQQASRVSDYTAFMYLGRLIEYGPTSEIFTRPRLKETESYVTGRFG